MGQPFLHLIIVPLFWQPNYVY